jgi:hypothetical protein
MEVDSGTYPLRDLGVSCPCADIRADSPCGAGDDDSFRPLGKVPLNPRRPCSHGEGIRRQRPAEPRWATFCPQATWALGPRFRFSIRP